MSQKLILSLSACVLLAGVVCLPVMAEDKDDKKPKFTTKEVMKKAFKGPLVKKVTKGDASDAEKKQLHEMLVAMAANKPPVGDADSWKKFTGALVKAGKQVVDGDAAGMVALKKSATCAACHKAHRPKKK